ncbi:MAG: hypothetical protein HWD84_06975 [Flavobacteriaceae bacterium]|jgi:hypothetical protein|nr:hypothetical protein [Flavobacteriaceae bacterium]NVJ72208.1 hypothetical protein [Flavobacteriaceae bacterium]
MNHNKHSARSVYHKAAEIDQISRALAVNESFDPELMSSYKHWSLQYRIFESINNDIKLLRKCLKKLTKTQNIEERLYSIKQVDSISFNLISYCNGLENNPSNNREYISLFKYEAIQFSKLYKKWVKSFSY